MFWHRDLFAVVVTSPPPSFSPYTHARTSFVCSFILMHRKKHLSTHSHRGFLEIFWRRSHFNRCLLSGFFGRWSAAVKSADIRAYFTEVSCHLPPPPMRCAQCPLQFSSVTCSSDALLLSSSGNAKEGGVWGGEAHSTDLGCVIEVIEGTKIELTTPIRVDYYKLYLYRAPTLLELIYYTVETAYKVPICPRGNLLYMWPYFIINLIISVNISFLLTPPSYPHGKSLFTSHFELNSWYK